MMSKGESTNELCSVYCLVVLYLFPKLFFALTSLVRLSNQLQCLIDEHDDAKDFMEGGIVFVVLEKL